MKTIFLGTSDFSVPFLKEIFKSKHSIQAVVTGTDRKKGRSKKVLPSPVKEAAKNLGINIIEIEKFSAAIIDEISNIDFDGMVCVSFGKILPEKLLNLCPGKCINLHPSLLPKYRGPSPITSTLLNGDAICGISIIKMTVDVDAGDIFIQAKMAVDPEDNKDTLEKKIISIGAPLMISVLNLIECGKIKTYPQGNKSISYTSMVTKDDLKICWSSKAEEIINRIRAFSTLPGSFTTWQGKIIKIIKALKTDDKDNRDKLTKKSVSKIGEIISADRQNGLRVRCNNDETIKIDLLKPEGRKIMTDLDFINGYSIKTGDFFE
ncbi:MAG: methionyl-tRNA formyltransferase [Cyanobacteria bacterium]|nr:methionyl-tRNA formyltransferase [Cyanobacteriota bacterium]